MIEDLIVGQLYSNDDIFTALQVGNAGGIRLSVQDKAVNKSGYSGLRTGLSYGK